MGRGGMMMSDLFSRRFRGFRVVELGGLAFFFVLALGVYMVKAGAGRDRAHIARIEREIIVEQTRLRLLRAEEDFLSSPSAAQMTVRDVQGVMQQVLDSAQAQAVLVRPDRYVLAYLDDQPESAHRLQAVLHAHGMDNQSLKA